MQETQSGLVFDQQMALFSIDKNKQAYYLSSPVCKSITCCLRPGVVRKRQLTVGTVLPSNCYTVTTDVFRAFSGDSMTEAEGVFLALFTLKALQDIWPPTLRFINNRGVRLEVPAG